MARGQRIGLVVLSSPAVHHWSAIDLHPYQATAAQLATALDHRRQQRLLVERGQQVAVLEERQRLARELHDSVTQLIFSTTLIAQSVAPAWRRDPAEGERRVQRLLELSQAALIEMRALLFELRPPEAATGSEQPTPGLARVRREGLAAALRQYADAIARDGLQVEVEASHYPARESLKRPPLAHEEALFRIAQEALNNAVKHAAARCVCIALETTQDAVQLSVSDDGAGFELNGNRAQGGGLGLKTMRERAEALGGSLRVTSTPGHGTRIEVALPKGEA
jgi:signal transduction histidine kinase